MVHLLEVAKFVGDHIVNVFFGHLDQLDIERDGTSGAATTPTGLHAPNFDVWWGYSLPLKFGEASRKAFLEYLLCLGVIPGSD